MAFCMRAVGAESFRGAAINQRNMLSALSTGMMAMPITLTFNVNDKLLCLDLEALLGAGPDFADPGPCIPQCQVGNSVTRTIVNVNR